MANLSYESKISSLDAKRILSAAAHNVDDHRLAEKYGVKTIMIDNTMLERMHKPTNQPGLEYR